MYKNNAGSEGVLTFNKNILYGNFELSENRVFKIETLPDLRHIVWAEIDQLLWNDEAQPLMADPDVEDLPHMRMEELLAKGRADPETVVEYTITVHYTKAFKEATADPQTFIEQVIAETNQGYINSKIPIRAKLHCVVESEISDGLDASTTLANFKHSQSSLSEVRFSADATILLVNQYATGGICGVNYFNTISSGNTVGTVRKGCALGDYSFGHELAHGFGLNHDRRVASYSSTDYGFGHVIQRGLYRSIMAYNTAGERRINYYSSPSVSFQNLPTGTVSNDNARTLQDVRFAVANIGDESMTCPNVVGAEPGAVPCEDLYESCAVAAETSCWHEKVQTSCPTSCGLCLGLTPHISLTCYDKFSNCGQLALLGHCSDVRVNTGCMMSCGGCV